MTTKEYWKLCFTFASISKAKTYLVEMKTTKEGTPAYEALFEAMVINYVLPFKNGKDRKPFYTHGPIPKELQYYHKDLERLRDKAIAHRDGDNEEDNTLELRVKPNHSFDVVFLDTGAIKPEHHDKIIELCDHHLKECYSKLRVQNMKMMPEVWKLTPGSYKIMISDEHFKVVPLNQVNITISPTHNPPP